MWLSPWFCVPRVCRSSQKIPNILLMVATAGIISKESSFPIITAPRPPSSAVTWSYLEASPITQPPRDSHVSYMSAEKWALPLSRRQLLQLLADPPREHWVSWNSERMQPGGSEFMVRSSEQTSYSESEKRTIEQDIYTEEHYKLKKQRLSGGYSQGNCQQDRRKIISQNLRKVLRTGILIIICMHPLLAFQ